MPSVARPAIQGVVFDLWNTLVYNHHDPNPIVALGEAFGIRGQEGWTRILERGMMLEKLAGIEEGIEAIESHTGTSISAEVRRELATIWRAACAQTRFFPEVRDVLGKLAVHFPLGLLSNTQSFDLDFMEAAGLPFHSRLFSYEEGV